MADPRDPFEDGPRREVPGRKVLGRSGRARPFRKSGGPDDPVGNVLDGMTRRNLEREDEEGDK